MNTDEEKTSECLMNETDSQGRSNLCCCYMMDEEGQYDDPCYYPPGECCGDE